MLIWRYLDEIYRLEEGRRKNEEAYEIRRKILKWLSLDDFEETHDMHFRKRVGDTGQWLLDDPCFKNWRDGTQSNILLCYGARKSQLYTCICTYINVLYRLL